jgi:hypothetical protein
VLLDRLGECESGRLGIRCSGHVAKQGDDVAMKGREGGIRVPGEGDDSFPKGQGLAGALRNPVEDRLATQGFEGRPDIVLFTF